MFVGEPKDRLAATRDRHSLQGSILDAIHGDAKSLERRIDKEDREKLDEYLTSVRDVERQLQLKEQWVEVPKPDAPFEQPKNKNMVEDLPLLYDLIVLALQTDALALRLWRSEAILSRRTWESKRATTAFPIMAKSRKTSISFSFWRITSSSTSLDSLRN